MQALNRRDGERLYPLFIGVRHRPILASHGRLNFLERNRLPLNSATTDEINASELIWAFFAAHPLP